jgi:hypothetical protein
MLQAVLAGLAYCILYLSLALVIGRLPRSDKLASPAAVRILFFSLVGLVGVLSPLTAVVLDLQSDHVLMNLFNPFIGTYNFARAGRGSIPEQGELLVFLGAVALLSVFAADRTLAERERRVHAA